MILSTLASSARAWVPARSPSARNTVSMRLVGFAEIIWSALLRTDCWRVDKQVFGAIVSNQAEAFGTITSPLPLVVGSPVTGATTMFDLQGHRGARGLWPENTLAGFARAIELGVSAVELDCGVTRDGVVVVSHDAELNPDCTRDARGHFLATAGPPIFALTYAQLQSYDVGRLRPGSAYAAQFPQQQPGDGERIPRRADVLTLVRTRGGGRGRGAGEVKEAPGPPELTRAPHRFGQARR